MPPAICSYSSLMMWNQAVLFFSPMATMLSWLFWWGPVVVSSMICRCSGSFSTRCWIIAFCAIDGRRDPVVDAESIAWWSPGGGCGCTDVDKMSTDHKLMQTNSFKLMSDIFLDFLDVLSRKLDVVSRKWCQKQNMQKHDVHPDARCHWCLSDTDSLMSSPVMSRLKKKTMRYRYRYSSTKISIDVVHIHEVWLWCDTLWCSPLVLLKEDQVHDGIQSRCRCLCSTMA